MPKGFPALLLGVAAAGISTDAPGQFATPPAKVFARPEDQRRARLLGVPCAQSDEGHACYRFDGRLVRKGPCTYVIEAGVIGSLPTDKCYKMKSPRRYRGVWVDDFEGQQFIPQGTTAPQWPRGDTKSSQWRKQADAAIAATIWLDVERTTLRHEWQQGGRRLFVEFVGRETKYPGHYGHMGMSGREIIVDHLILQHDCPQTGACG